MSPPSPAPENPTSSARPDPARPARRRSSFVPWLLVVLLLAAGSWAGWQAWSQWQLRQNNEQGALADARQQLDAIDARMDTVRQAQRAQAKRLQQAEATNRVLREELLGMGERAALIEDSVGKLVDGDRDGIHALRLDEAELLLTLGEQRLRIAGDLDGARHAYALAASTLQDIDDPALVSLRQALMQERAALEALGVDPRVRALTALDAFAQGLHATPPRDPVRDDAKAPWWKRAFASIVQVQREENTIATLPGDRAAANAGLQLELSLARAAAERRDVAGWKTALQRADQWLQQLWPVSTARKQRRKQLADVAAMPLSLSLPTLGSTLAHLRQVRAPI